MFKEDVRKLHYEESRHERVAAMKLHRERFKDLVDGIPNGIKNQLCKLAFNAVREPADTPYLMDIEIEILPKLLSEIERMKDKSKTKEYYLQHPQKVKDALKEILERYILLRKAENGEVLTDTARRATELFIINNRIETAIHQAFNKEIKDKLGKEDVDRIIEVLKKSIFEKLEEHEYRQLINF